MVKDYFKRVSEAAAYISSRLDISPKVMLVLSGGLSEFVGKIEEAVVIMAADVPHFPTATAEGHSGKMTFGKIGGIPLAALQGRFHYYEGHRMSDIIFPLFVMSALGAGTLILTSATGGINKDFKTGDIVLIKDHINLMGANPLVGISTLRPENQFPDMTDAYSKKLRPLAHSAAATVGIKLNEGVYVASSGPSYETPAEIIAFRQMGADVAGMSVVPEIIAAKFLKMETLAFSCIANPAADIHPGGMNHQEVLQAMKKMEKKLSSLLFAVIKQLEDFIV